MAIVLSGEKPIVENEPINPALPKTEVQPNEAQPEHVKKTFKLRWYVWTIIVVLVLGIIAGMAWYWGWWSKAISALTNDTKSADSASGPEEPVVTYFENPINGVMLESGEALSEAMERRPLCVIIENHPDARPHYGLAEADLVYEALAEGGITRFEAVVWSTAPERLMPVRSARAYFVVWATDIEGCVFHHIGEAHSSDSEINVRSVVNKYGVLRIGDRAFLRDSECRKTKNQEHCAYSLPETLWSEAEKTGWTGGIEKVQTFKFKEDIDPFASQAGVTDYSDGIHSFHLSLSRSSSQNNYETVWTYDPETNAYFRSHGTLSKSTPHKDAASGEQLSVKNVAIQRVTVRSTGDRKNHNKIEVIGTGDALILMDGKVIEGTWSKPNGDTRTKFYDAEGNEIVFNRGQIWIQAMPTGNKVDAKTPAGTSAEF